MINATSRAHSEHNQRTLRDQRTLRANYRTSKEHSLHRRSAPTPPNVLLLFSLNRSQQLFSFWRAAPSLYKIHIQVKSSASGLKIRIRRNKKQYYILRTLTHHVLRTFINKYNTISIAPTHFTIYFVELIVISIFHCN